MTKVLLMAVGLLFVKVSVAQIIVDNKNVSADTSIHYFQLLYYIDKGKSRPVYFLDYGIVESRDGMQAKQRLKINGVDVGDAMSPVTLINKFYASGWKYLGDQMYVQVPMVENWYSLTFERIDKNSTR